MEKIAGEEVAKLKEAQITAKELTISNCSAGEDSGESLGLQADQACES